VKRETPRARTVLIRHAEERLWAEGLSRARAYRVERRSSETWCAAYERGGNAWTAIFEGELPEDWRLLRTVAGWPVDAEPGARGRIGSPRPLVPHSRRVG
jgi:hypothetical protein